MGERKELRVKMVLPVRVSGTDNEGKPYSLLAHTLDFSRLGARLGGVCQPVRVGETLTLEYKLRRARFVIRWVGTPVTRSEHQVGIQSLEPENFLWLDVPEQKYTDQVDLSCRRAPDIDAQAVRAAAERLQKSNDSAGAASNKTRSLEDAMGGETLLVPSDEPVGKTPIGELPPTADQGNGGKHSEALRPNQESIVAALEQRITAEALSVGAALELLAVNAQRLLNGTGAAIALPEKDEMVCRASAGRAPAVGVHFRVEAGLTAEAVRTGRVIHCHNTQADSRVNPELWRRVGIQSTISAPIALSESRTAVLEVFAAQPNAFTSADAKFLQALSELVSRVAGVDGGSCSRPATRSSEEA